MEYSMGRKLSKKEMEEAIRTNAHFVGFIEGAAFVENHNRRLLEQAKQMRLYLPNKIYTDDMFIEYFRLVKTGYVREIAARLVLSSVKIDEEKFAYFMRSANKWDRNRLK
jgi:hypothetical protein